ncbi:MAG: hypothetical protein K9H06_20330 [Melioribacteraceae bacterium]|nr:hypothetical protein [Melioribacteraceae bacterium]MCF8420971.1 hypothetical protein [Melioribacteraceae bacterium]
MINNLQQSFKAISRAVGILLFVTLLFTNINIALQSDEVVNKGSISFLGMEIQLFEPTYADVVGDGCNTVWCAEIYSCISDGLHSCAFFYCNPGPGGFYCFYVQTGS